MTIRETLLKERRNRHVRQALFNETIEGLRSRIFPLARLVHELALTLESPTLIDRGMERGFRFDKPELLHFCLLRGARIVSALNASIELGRRGYSQEIAVLLRTCIEYCSQVDFMLASRDANGNLSPDASAYLSSFFEDSVSHIGRQKKTTETRSGKSSSNNRCPIGQVRRNRQCEAGGSIAIECLPDIFVLRPRPVSRIDGPVRRVPRPISPKRNEQHAKRRRKLADFGQRDHVCLAVLRWHGARTQSAWAIGARSDADKMVRLYICHAQRQ